MVNYLNIYFRSTSPSDSPRRKKFKTSKPLEDNENYRLQSLEKSISQVKITTSVRRKFKSTLRSNRRC